MTKRIKTLVITFGVLVLLAGGYIASTLWNERRIDALLTDFPGQRLGNLDSSNLVKIEVNDMVLERKNGIWELVSLEGRSPPEWIELDQNQIISLTWTLASVWTEQTVDEYPQDLSVYGLDDPYSRIIVTDSYGTRIEYILGDMTPSRTAFFMMKAGDPQVHTVSIHAVRNMNFGLDRIRQRSLFPVFAPHNLTRLQIESPQTQMEIIARPETVPSHLITSFSTHLITSPFAVKRGVNGEALNTMITPLRRLMVADFIDDSPSSLVPFGLDNPARIFIETRNASIELLIGNCVNLNPFYRFGCCGLNHEMRYAKISNKPGVFTIAGLEPILNIRPFALMDRFALFVNIDQAENLTISGGERFLSADIQGTRDDTVFYLNGKRAEPDSFRRFYHAVAGLIIDAERPGPPGTAEQGGAISIEYRLNNPSGERVSITLVPFNRDFYELRQEGIPEFLVSRNQVRRIFETANAVTEYIP